MRIVIDLQICQGALACLAPGHDALEEALALARLEGRHEIWIVLRNHNSAAIEAIRCAFDGLIPRSRIVVIDLPWSGQGQTSDWQQRANEQIRESFLASLAPDIVYISHFFESSPQAEVEVEVEAEAEAVYSIGPLSGDCLTALSVFQADAVAQATQEPASEQQYRLQASLQHAAILFTRVTLSSQEHDAIRSKYAAPSCQVVPLTGGIACANARLMHDTFEKAVQAKRAMPLAAVVPIDAARPAPHGKKLRLAYISPLPPAQSGIADYSAELIPELARHYEIDAILDQSEVSTPWIKAHIPLRSVAWFEAHADEYDRVLYHLGNSPMHQHMFELFERHPGVLVLHDFYVGNVLYHLDHNGHLPGVFFRSLYRSHGFAAFLDVKKLGINDVVWKYPCNQALLDQASGVIVHSVFPAQLARAWYGEQMTDDWRVIPLLRGKPAADQQADQAAQEAHSDPHASARHSARAQLAIAESDFVMCSFGMLGQTKLNERLLDAWLASGLAHDPRCQLIFAGANDGGPYGEALLRKIAAIHGDTGSRIQITGYVTHAQYRHYLAAADGAVQLRTQSRGETSASVLDCLLYGVPVIVNAHGSSAELPADVLLKLDEDCPLQALADALVQLRDQPALRAMLARQATNYMQAQHAPGPVGLLYRDAIEHFATHDKRQPFGRAYQRLLHTLGHIPTLTEPDPDALQATAAAIAANQPPLAPRQLFVDISAMVQTDLKTGIQRVVRSVLMALVQQPPAGYRIEPIYSRGNGQPYLYARQYMLAQFGIDDLELGDAPLEVRAGDLFLGLDLFMHGTAQNLPRLQDMRNRGVEIHFIIYDILPLLRPEVFPTGSEADFRRWLQTAAAVSDGLVCISRAVADEVATWLATQPPMPRAPLKLGYFHLGADIHASAPSFGLPDNAEQVLQTIRSRPSLLMVGTVEPRKGQAQALAAFELLWAQGVEVNLVIVGKHGWMVDALAARMRAHPENGQRLFWLEGCSDEMLLALYASCSALLAASEGEGFGLPLIEAAQHQLPIIARDLPVFREVTGSHATYFDGLSPAALADALTTWLALFASGNAPASTGLEWLTWEQSAQQLLDAIIRQQWYKTMPSSSHSSVKPAIESGKDYNANQVAPEY
jgi:glycosyltransferase involved in cell wall biosynthesis